MNLHLVVLMAAALVLIPVRPAPFSFAEEIRHCVYDGAFYPRNPDELKALIRDLRREAKKTRVPLTEGASLKALVLPHAGYIYSGPTAAHGCLALENQRHDKVIIMGPDHRVGFNGAVITDARGFETPLGMVPVHPDAARLRNQHLDIFHTSPASDRAEHCIEVILPYLQAVLPAFQIIPLVMGQLDPNTCAGCLDPLLTPDTLVVVSSDLSHYLPYDTATATDRETIQWILNLDAQALAGHPDRACGGTPLRVLMQLAAQHGWRPQLLHYANSGDTAGPKDRVVGYAAIGFFEQATQISPESSGAAAPDTPRSDTTNNPTPKRREEPMDEAKGDLLIKLARRTIAQRLGAAPEPDPELETALKDEAFSARQGTFVTLTINDQLRGCIGNLLPERPIRQGVADNALNAAFHDPRFPALTRRELASVAIEISLLTDPKPLAFKDGADLLAKLRPGIDGVIIRKSGRSATFLPQVWDQLPDKKLFLSHLCAKAGLSPDAWQEPGMTVQTYQVQYFHEKPRP